MKKYVKNRLLLTCVVSVVSLSIFGCGHDKDPVDTKKSPDTVQLQGSEKTPEKNAEKTPDLTGSIKEMQGKQLTVIENVTETSEDGGETMISPGDGDDSEFNKIPVIYDESTLFSIQTIYNGGDKQEVTEATADDLSVGDLIAIWGTSQEDKLIATHIRIIKVVIS
ncbi:MAG: hypothetical protein HFH53_02575 [Hespellia sp.]|nr:hypothetical protein [Hespellia sp.]